MNTKLITALRTAANAVENKTFDYNWSLPSRCNCGVVACALLDKSSVELNAMLQKAHINQTKDSNSLTWQERVGIYCPITGVPNDTIFSQLFRFGLTQTDIVELENLSNADVLARLPNKYVKETRPTFFWQREVEVKAKRERSNRDDLVAYLRAWADLLMERDAVDKVNEDVDAVLKT